MGLVIPVTPFRHFFENCYNTAVKWTAENTTREVEQLTLSDDQSLVGKITVIFGAIVTSVVLVPWALCHLLANHSQRPHSAPFSPVIQQLGQVAGVIPAPAPDAVVLEPIVEPVVDRAPPEEEEGAILMVLDPQANRRQEVIPVLNVAAPFPLVRENKRKEPLEEKKSTDRGEETLKSKSAKRRARVRQRRVAPYGFGAGGPRRPYSRGEQRVD